MEDKISKGGNYKRFKKVSKREHGNSGTKNLVNLLSKVLDLPLYAVETVFQSYNGGQLT